MRSKFKKLRKQRGHIDTVDFIEQKPVWVRVAGKQKNFRLLYLTIHTSEVMETKVCRVPGGGCGHEAYETGLKSCLGQLESERNEKNF